MRDQTHTSEDATAEDLFPQPRCAHTETKQEMMPDGSAMLRCTTCLRVTQVINHP